MCDQEEKRRERNKRYRMVEKMKLIPRREYLVTVRYKDDTYEEMQKYCEKYEKQGIKCAYGCPIPVSQVVVQDSILIVLEMNNDQNRIMGVGLVRNTLQEANVIGQRVFNIHDDGNLNRYVYLGSKHIKREEMSEEEEEVMTAFDILCFYGTRHMKRCVGLTLFPMDTIEKCKRVMDLPNYLLQMFKKRNVK
jgi:hypothetical protein